MLSSFLSLKRYCESEGFKGWDPYDGLNSLLAHALLPLKRSAILRLCVIQGFKRCPVNLRRLAMVPKEYNAKGIGLFLQGYCNLVRAVDKFPELQAEVGTRQVTGERRYLDVALSSADFVMNDLHRAECGGGFLFSYSPLKGNDTVFNASLLGSKLLAYCYKYTKKEEYREAARRSVEACCDAQGDAGEWVYGMLPVQSWIDSFHTGYNLDGLTAYEEQTGDKSFHSNIEKGFDFYIRNFFEADGTPKYYHDRTYPIDIHCPAQLFVTLHKLHRSDEYRAEAERVMRWTVENMQDRRGYFYYQLKQGVSSKISYMRWSNAFMFCAMSYYILDYGK